VLCRQSRGESRRAVAGQNSVSASQEAEPSGWEFHSRDAPVGKALRCWQFRRGGESMTKRRDGGETSVRRHARKIVVKRSAGKRHTRFEKGY